MIDKPILELLTFGSNPDFSDFGVFCVMFCVFLRMFSGFFGPKGGCASSRLDHGFLSQGSVGADTQHPQRKKQFLDYFLAFFPYIWPLAGPNIAKKGWPLCGKALGRFWKS